MSRTLRRGAATLAAAGFLLPALVPPALAQPASARRDGTVVVVPFTNVSGRPADDWIGSGLAETVAADLRNAGLSVVAPLAADASNPLPGGNGNGNGNGGNGNGNGNGNGWSAPGDPLEAHRRRGVTWLVDGGLQRIGDRLRVTTRVVDVGSGAIAFSTRVDGTFDDLFDIQDEVGAALAARLAAEPRVAGVPADAATPFGRVAPAGGIVPAAPDPLPERNSATAPARAGVERRRRNAVPGRPAAAGSRRRRGSVRRWSSGGPPTRR